MTTTTMLKSSVTLNTPRARSDEGRSKSVICGSPGLLCSSVPMEDENDSLVELSKNLGRREPGLQDYIGTTE